MSKIQSNVLRWIATGRVGASSKAMAMAACDMPTDGAYPSDPADLNRCLLMLEAVPEARQQFAKVAAISRPWANFIENWEKLEAMFLEEVGLNWSKAQSAPRTYEFMKSLRAPDGRNVFHVSA